MKTFLLTLLILTVSLQARENPFEPTSAYLEEEARLLEMEADFPSQEFQKHSQERVELEDMTPRKMPVNKVHPKAVEKTQEQMKAEMFAKQAMEMAKKKELMMQQAMKKAEMAKKAEEARIAKEKAEALKKGPLIYVKLRDDVKITNKLEILPFVSIDYDNKILNIHTKYKVFKKLYLLKEKKLIIDFYGDVLFYTKRHDLKSENFKKITLGNHKAEKYFRVVIETKNPPSQYNVNYKDALVTIISDEHKSN